ncbi:MAG: hypothetical protein VW738_08930, partial [Pseudomonadales bacterium]
MSDQTLSNDGLTEANNLASSEIDHAARTARDFQRLRNVAFYHGQYVVGGLLLWGASAVWLAESPGL